MTGLSQYGIAHGIVRCVPSVARFSISIIFVFSVNGRGTEMTTLNAHSYFNVAISIAMLAEFAVCVLIVALYVLA